MYKANKQVCEPGIIHKKCRPEEENNVVILAYTDIIYYYLLSHYISIPLKHQMATFSINRASKWCLDLSILYLLQDIFKVGC